MKKILGIVVFASLFPLTAFAQNSGPVGGVDAMVAVPLGNLGDAAGLGFGGLLRYEFTVVPRANITARAGLIYHLPKDVGPTTFKFFSIPLLAGLKVNISPSLYAAAELGLFINHASISGGGFSGSDTKSKLGMTIGAGYRLLSSLDLRIGLAALDFGHFGDTMEFLAGIGYYF